jgi:hypothetical protein
MPTGDWPEKVSSGQMAEAKRGMSRVLPWQGMVPRRAGGGPPSDDVVPVAAKTTPLVRWTMWEKISSNDV